MWFNIYNLIYRMWFNVYVNKLIYRMWFIIYELVY